MWGSGCGHNDHLAGPTSSSHRRRNFAPESSYEGLTLPMTQEISEAELDKIMRDPRAFFSEPRYVVAHPQLSREQKLADSAPMGTGRSSSVGVRSEGMGGGGEEYARPRRKCHPSVGRLTLTDRSADPAPRGGNGAGEQRVRREAVYLAAAIRAVFEQRGELSAVVELRRCSRASPTTARPASACA